MAGHSHSSPAIVDLVVASSLRVCHACWRRQLLAWFQCSMPGASGLKQKERGSEEKERKTKPQHLNNFLTRSIKLPIVKIIHHASAFNRQDPGQTPLLGSASARPSLVLQ